MVKKNIDEDTKAAFQGNVDNNVNKMDKPKKIDGEIEVVNKKAHLKATDELPDYAAATSKDTSKSAKVASTVSADAQKGTMKNMPMVKKLDEDEDTEGDELTEEEIAAYNEHRKSVMESLAVRLNDYIPSDDQPVDMTEHVNVLFEGSDLSEEFKAKATTLFETAVRAETLTVLGSILEAATDLVIENDIALTEAYDEKIDNSLAVFAESWAEANIVGIQSRLKTEITEDFLHGMVKLFQDHNIFLPEEKVDVVESLTDRVVELEGTVNEQLDQIIELRSALNESYKDQIIDQITEGLTDVQATKLRNLCEGINSAEDFETAALQIKESYFGNKTKSKIGSGLGGEENVLTESEVNAEAKMIAEEASKPKQGEIPAVLSRFAPRR